MIQYVVFSETMTIMADDDFNKNQQTNECDGSDFIMNIFLLTKVLHGNPLRANVAFVFIKTNTHCSRPLTTGQRAWQITFTIQLENCIKCLAKFHATTTGEKKKKLRTDACVRFWKWCTNIWLVCFCGLILIYCNELDILGLISTFILNNTGYCFRPMLEYSKKKQIQ